MIIELILAIVFVEAVTEILTSSKITEKLRIKAWEYNTWLGELTHCGYCMSVWVSAIVAWTVDFGIENSLINYFISLFVIHRVSNVLHEAIVRWLNRAPITFHVQLNGTMEKINDASRRESLDAGDQKSPEDSTRIDLDTEFLTAEETA